jgi:2-methylcitrate dehydratase PrpD
MITNPPVTALLANFVATLPRDAIPARVRRRATLAVLDWTGVTLAAVRESETLTLRRSVLQFAGPPQATIFGLPERTDALTAALVNGFASHLLDFDDVDMQWIAHPSVTVLPAVLAAAQWQDASGADLLDAFIVGLQVQNRIGRSLMPDHYRRGHHSTATIGPFGAAAGVARLLRLPASQVETALGIAGTQAAGLRRMFGTMCKPLQAGHAAATGLRAAVLARDGVTSAGQIIEAADGFARVMSADFDAARAVADLTTEWAVDAIEFKSYPSCRATHGLLDCLLSAKLPQPATEISAVEIRIAKMASEIARIANPTTVSEARFSQHYCAAVALLEGRAVFTAAKLADAGVRELMKKVTIIGDETIPVYGAATAVITYRNGQRAEFAFNPRADNAGEADQLCAKFRDLASASLIPAILAIEQCERVNQLVETINHA